MAYSIVVVTWECADYLVALVRTMNRHLDGSQEFVVVDNASSDSPSAAATSWKGPLRYVQLETNEGFGRANNVGVGEASHDVVVLLNPDTLLVDQSLDGLAQAASELSGLVGPRVLNPDGSIQPSASGSPVGVWPWVNAFVPGMLMPTWMQARTEPWRLERTTRVVWLTGVCIAAPRKLLLELGPFDETIELFSEDLDLGLRAARKRTSSYIAPLVCRIVHYRDASAARRFGDRGTAAAAQNRRLVLARLFSARTERAAWWSERVKLELRVLAKTALRRPRAAENCALRALRAAPIPQDGAEGIPASQAGSHRSTPG